MRLAEAEPHSIEQFAGRQALQPREIFRIFLDEVGELVQQPAALGGSHFVPRPSFKCGPSGPDRAIKAAEPAIYDPNQAIPSKGLADVERMHRENGRTDYDKPIDLKKVVDDQFVDKAIAALGKAKN